MSRHHRPTPKLPAGWSGFRFGIATAVKASGVVRVKVGRSVVGAQCPRDLTVAAGDAVVMAKSHGTYWIINRYFVSANGTIDLDGTDEPAAPGATVIATTVILPTSTATRLPSGWRAGDDVCQGIHADFGNMTGCVFYGGRLRPLAGVTVLEASMHARRLPGGVWAAQQTTLWGVVESSRPAGAPTLSGTSYTGPDLAVNATAVVAVNTGLAQDLVDGAYAGVALYDGDGDPHARYAGVRAYAGAFALTLKWRR